MPKPDNHVQWLGYRVHRSCLVLNYRQPFYEPMIRFTAGIVVVNLTLSGSCLSSLSRGVSLGAMATLVVVGGE